MAEPLASTEPTPAEAALQHWLERNDDDEQVTWGGLIPGPTVAELAARLSGVPRDFLSELVDLTALGGDVLGSPGAALISVYDGAQPWAASRQGVALGLWLYASEELTGPFDQPLRRVASDRMLAALGFRLAAVVDPYRWLVEADRREEAARTVILWSGQHPGDEDYPTARSRWSALDSLRRDQALQTAMADYRHRQEVMRRLEEERAREAAIHYNPE